MPRPVTNENVKQPRPQEFRFVDDHFLIIIAGAEQLETFENPVRPKRPRPAFLFIFPLRANLQRTQ